MFLPVLELFMLGYAIDTNVRHVRTVVFDEARTQESRSLLLRFTNSEDFTIVGEVFTDRDLAGALVAGRARVGIKIPEAYSRRVQSGRTAQVLILVDGSESSVAAEAVNVGNAIALSESLERLLGGRAMPVEARPRILFNPDTRSANFFIPGLMVVLCQMMAIMLSANAIVREKERGTLEQLFMTPVRRGELVIGKMLPYLGLVLFEFCVDRLPDDDGVRRAGPRQLRARCWRSRCRSSWRCSGWGLAISTKATTRDASMQMSIGDGAALGLPLGLRVPARLDAAALLAALAASADHLDDRRGTRGDPPRRRLGRALAARRGALGHGAGLARRQRGAVPQAAGLTAEQSRRMAVTMGRWIGPHGPAAAGRRHRERPARDRAASVGQRIEP